MVKTSTVLIMLVLIIVWICGHPAFSSRENLEPLYLAPNKELAKFMGLGMNALAADIFFLKVINYIGEGAFPRGKWNLDWIYQNLGLALELDPGFEGACFLGGMIIPNDEESRILAVKLLEKAGNRTPSNWKIPFWIGFNYYQARRYQEAGDYFNLSAALPGAPGHLAGMRILSYYQAGNSQASLVILNSLLESASKKDSGWIKAKIEWLEKIAYLEEAVEKFKQRFARPPEDLNELTKTGIIGSIPQDPWLGGYYLDAKNKKVVSRMRSD